MAALEEAGLESGGPSGGAVPDDGSRAERGAQGQQGRKGESAVVAVQMHDDSLVKYDELRKRTKTCGGETCPRDASSCAAAASCRSSSALLVYKNTENGAL